MVVRIDRVLEVAVIGDKDLMSVIWPMIHLESKCVLQCEVS